LPFGIFAPPGDKQKHENTTNSTFCCTFAKRGAKAKTRKNGECNIIVFSPCASQKMFNEWATFNLQVLLNEDNAAIIIARFFL
jgi:hypothetical protein